MSPKIVSHWILLNFLWLKQKKKKVVYKTNVYVRTISNVNRIWWKLCSFGTQSIPKFKVWNLHYTRQPHTHKKKALYPYVYEMFKKIHVQKKVKLDCMHEFFKRKGKVIFFVFQKFLKGSDLVEIRDRYKNVIKLLSERSL